MKLSLSLQPGFTTAPEKIESGLPNLIGRSSSKLLDLELNQEGTDSALQANMADEVRLELTTPFSGATAFQEQLPFQQELIHLFWSKWPKLHRLTTVLQAAASLYGLHLHNFIKYPRWNSNPQPAGPKPAASANCATRASWRPHLESHQGLTLRKGIYYLLYDGDLIWHSREESHFRLPRP